MQVGYARTSTEEQVAGLEAQVRDLEAAGCERVYREQVSALGDRPELANALSFLRSGDTLVITKIDRLARNTRALGDVVDDLHKRGIGLKVLQFGKETVDTTGAYGRLMLNMFAAFAEFERDLMKERQKEGIAKAKAEQKYKGRKPTARAKAGEAIELFRQGRSVSEIAKAVGIGRGSVYRALEAAGLKDSSSSP
ncbi:DNA invertase Pin-like site-specific DNA recombinase [Sinorhizobium medicae]|uniref:recombinase family protein n=1 Tax=Sinorhizobium medicae TaxID=110321 RepID=UPI0011A7614C|nr:recombinase family protein [Sinorhizobium medicae]MDX1068973.1 helix-turn-helix domain-containing protein [Sinorhizobium medicae]TWA21132.1 DNA invertase Pin-like site-specific DNA recombinase [Sinorhizobium medicae]